MCFGSWPHGLAHRQHMKLAQTLFDHKRGGGDVCWYLNDAHGLSWRIDWVSVKKIPTNNQSIQFNNFLFIVNFINPFHP
jgi:hypothetical protein